MNNLNEEITKGWAEAYGLNESKEKIELTGDEVTSKILKPYDYKDITYKGESLEDLYFNKFLPFANEYLGLNKGGTYTIPGEPYKEYDNPSGQESYLGYIPEEDIFISGWDTDGSWNGCLVFIKVLDNGKLENIVKYEKDYTIFSSMYYKNPKMGSLYNKLHKDFKKLIDIRLD